MNYGIIMKELRNEILISQKDVAEKMNIKRSTFKEYELQNSIIPVKHLNSFCNIFNVSIDYLLGLNNLRQYENSEKEITNKKIILRLKEFRKDNNLTQSKLAMIMKVGNGTIGDYERGARSIATPFLYDICKKYKISADYLLGKIDEPKYLK